MKQGTSLQETIIKIQRENEAKKDYIVPAQYIRIEDNGDIFTLDDHNSSHYPNFVATDLFHQQVATALSIPAKYYDLMRSEKPDLLAKNVNSWFHDSNKSYMFRAITNNGIPTARALLSSRYRRIDNGDIAEAVLPLFAGREGVEVISSAVTEQRMYLKILNKRIEREVKPGDYVQAGVVISNSEVGLGAVSVKPLIYRLVCTNGMVVDDFGERRNHVGRAMKSSDDKFDLYTDETLEAEDKAFMLKLRDVTLAAIEEARFDRIVDTLRESAEAKITGRIQDVVELTSKEYNLNQTEQNSVLSYLVNGGDLSLYGLGNAITRTSQDVESYDRATLLEGIGWQVTTMNPTQWRRLNNDSV